MIKKRLTEDTVEQAIKGASTQAEKEDIKNAGEDLGEPLVSDDNGEIETVLNSALRINLRNHKHGNRNFFNVLFVGEAGTGKTARIKAWARKYNINLVTTKAGELDDTDTGGVLAGNITDQVAVRLASTEFDQLGEGMSVLFLDEWNRAPSSVRQSLLTLVQDHTVTDPRVKGRMRYIPGFLFTVAAINPYDDDYDVNKLDQAELGRVSVNTIAAKVEDWGKYMKQYYTQLAQRAKESGDEVDSLVYAKIANLTFALVNDPKFKFDTRETARVSAENDAWNGLLTTPRNVTNALEESEGDKEVFLNAWNKHCNNLEYKTIEDILKNYVDIDDKANQALKSHQPKDKLFKSEKDSDLDELDSIQASLKSQIGN